MELCTRPYIRDLYAAADRIALAELENRIITIEQRIAELERKTEVV